MYVLISLVGVILAGVLALAGFIIQQYVKGELVARPYYQDAVARAAVAEAGEVRAEDRETKWRDAYERGAETIRLLTDSLARIAAINGTTSQILAATLPASAGAAPDQGGAGVPVA